MSLIDETYFAYEPCYLGTFEGSNGYGQVEEPKLLAVKRSILRFEPKYLQLLMGEELYSEYVSSISNAKWLPLKQKLLDTTNKISPIANYVYFYHRKEHKFESGDTVDYQTKKDNMVAVQPETKMINAWNDMVELNIVVCKWIWDYIICAETPAIETTATWDYSQWEEYLLTKENGFV